MIANGEATNRGDGKLLFEGNGSGMHTGKACRVVGVGLPEGAGRWIDREGGLSPMEPERLNADLRCSRLGATGPLEHFAAAFVIAGWEDWKLEVSQDDLPLLDGSGAFASWVPLQRRRIWELSPDWGIALGNERGGRLQARSSPEFSVISRVKLPDGTIQEWKASEAVLPECLRARTFIGIDELALALNGCLLQGCEPSQAQILGPATTDAGRRLALDLGMDPDAARLNGAERFPGECAAHKVLDLVGDLGLFLGALPRVEIVMENVGHQEFHALGRGLRAQLRLLG